MHWLFPVFVSLLAFANKSTALVPSQVIVQITESQANCSGVVVSPNLILTSAQCVQFKLPNFLKVYTKSSERNPLNVTLVHIPNFFKPTNLTNDVALLQINGSTIVKPVLIDTHQVQTAHCEANFVHGSTSYTNSYNIFNCSALAYINSTSCTNYTITDQSMCNQNHYKLAAERGTPIVCNGLLSGIVSAIIQKPTPYCTASAYITQITPKVGNWISQQILANRPAVQPVKYDPLHPNHPAPQGTGTGPASTSGHHHGAHGSRRNGTAAWLSSVLMVLVAVIFSMGISV